MLGINCPVVLVVEPAQPYVRQGTSLLASRRNEGTGSHEYLKSYVTEFLDSHAIRGRQWVIFAAAWNEVGGRVRVEGFGCG